MPRTRARLTVTPLEDRTVPTVLTISAVTTTLAESSSPSPVQVTVTRDNTSGGLSFNYSISGTATNGSDYSAAPPVGFMPGQSTAVFTITPINDSISEPTETVIITLGAGTGYTVGTPSSVTLSLLDNDADVVTVAKVGDTTEGVAGAFQFTRTGDLSSSLTANYSVGGTATSGTDFTALGGTVTFAAGSATANVSVAPLADNLVEGSETVVATVTSGSGYTVGSPSSATMNIADDPPVISIEATDTSEGSATGGFTLTRTGGDLSSSLTVSYTVGGTATSGTDYTALSGSATFAAGKGTVDVDVEALGDNTVDDGETVTATLSGAGSTYTINGGADDATVTIADEPVTVSVLRLTDGFEGASNGSFRFTRSGDISSSLTVTYTVSGTATAGSDYTALSGTVTFAANSDYTDVTVYVTDDATVEPTETVTVTLDTSGSYQLGNDSDTLFIKDNDTALEYWVSTGSTDWNVGSNWSSGTVPVAGQDVYFNGSGGPYNSNVSCTNAGYGLSGNLAGIHIVGSYSGTVSLATALSVGTYEQTSGTLDQSGSTLNLTVTKAMLWSGGTLNSSTTSDAVVNVDGADGLIDPPDTGSMAIGSTLNVINGSVLTLLSGTLNFIGGSGMYIAADVKLLQSTNANVDVAKTTSNALQIEIAPDGTLAIWRQVRQLSVFPWVPGYASTELGLLNSGGTLMLGGGTFLNVTGSVPGWDGFNVVQTSGTTKLASGGTLIVEDNGGMDIEGGTLLVAGFLNVKDARLVGSLLMSGGVLKFDYGYAAFTVSGDVTWNGGSYEPRFDGNDTTKRDQWFILGSLSVGASATIFPDCGNPDAAASNDQWAILYTGGGCANAAAPLVPALQAGWEINAPQDNGRSNTWFFRKK